ncbi:MAG: FUSC family protein [Stellaceae bacterium]
MHAFWVALGIVVLGLGLLDLFLTALNYDEAGFLATRLCVLQWRCLRSITRRLSRRWRPIALRQITGLQIVLSVTIWLGFVVIGFGLIYYGLMYGTNFQYDGRGVGAGIFGAMYLSAAQLSTVGTSQISPETDLLRALTIVETLSAALLVSLILTFLLGVYQVVRDLRTLSANFVTAEPTAGDPVASLEPYFPQGQPVGIDSHLQAISDSFWSYTDGLRLHHIAYYFQSGRDQFSLPYVLHMLGGSLAALRWGLPAGNPAAAEPLLPRLSTQFEGFTDYLHGQLAWTSNAVPEVVSFEDFSAAQRGTGEASDYWLGRFLRLNRDMARMARLDSAGDPRDAYGRYQQWLPFAYRAEQLTAAVSRDLDYRPVFRGGERARVGAGPVTSGSAADGPHGVTALLQHLLALLNRWVAVPDPGFSRLTEGAGAVLAAAAAVGTLVLLFTLTGVPALAPAMFGGMVGMYAVIMPGDATEAGRRLTTALIVLPAIGAATLGAAVAPSFALSIAVMVVVVLLGVWVGGFGPRLAAIGQMAFMSYYFGLLLHFRLTLVPAFAVAAAVGAIWAYLFRFVFLADRPDRVLHGGLAAFRARLVLMFDPLIDAVSAARWDPDISRRVRGDMRQLHRCAAFLQGQLRTADPEAPGPQASAGELRLRLFDTELAANYATATARRFAGSGAVISIALRAQLAGMLERAQAHLRREAKNASRPPSSTVPADHKKPKENQDRPPERWPEQARRLHGAVCELLRVAGAMQDVETADLADPHIAAREIATDTDPSATQSDPVPEQQQSSAGSQDYGLQAPTSRRAIQAAAATGLAVLAGATVTPTHQYWAALAAFLVLGSTETIEETFVKGLARIAGTIAGAAVGFGVTAITGANPSVVLPLLAFCVFAAMYLRPLSYALMIFWITMMLALLYEFLGTLTAETLEVRAAETVIGAAIALGAAALLLPARARQKVNSDGVAFLQTLEDIIQACLKRLAGTADVASLADQALTLGQRFRRLNTSAAPLRRVAGALRRDGIERRLTAIAALTYYARYLIKATEAFAPDTAPFPTAACAQLAAFTRDNISALVRILNGEPPGPMHGSEDLPLQPDTSPETRNTEREAALHYVVRINETVLALIEDLTRDTAEPARDTASPSYAT